MAEEKTFEEHLREIADSSPGIGVATAVRYADARMRGEEAPLPEPWDSRQVADWAKGNPGVTDLISDRYIDAIKEIRGLGHQWGIEITLKVAKDAVDILRSQRERDRRGCCTACGGTGGTMSGPCSDCFATGHCHPESEPCE